MNGRSFFQEYQLDKEISSGAFGTVFRCTNKHGETRAVKIINRIQSNYGPLDEAAIMNKLKHRSIPTIYDIFDEENDSRIYLVMEYCEGISLYNYLCLKGRIPDHDAVFITFQILNSLKFIHENGIAHLDIKPENIIVDPNSLSIKIIDFGFATEEVEKCDHYVGSLNFTAPELLQRKPFDAKKADMWSVGVIHYTMVTGFIPWTTPSDRLLPQSEIIAAILKASLRPLPLPVSPVSQVIMKSLLVFDPKKRLSANDTIHVANTASGPKCLRSPTTSIKARSLGVIIKPRTRKCGSVFK